MSFGAALFEAGFRLMVWAAILFVSVAAGEYFSGTLWVGPLCLAAIVWAGLRARKQAEAERRAERPDDPQT